MSEDWAGAAEDVRQALAEVSETPAYIVFKEFTGGTAFNPGSATEREVPVAAAQGKYNLRDIDGQTIQQSDIKVTISAPSDMPQPSKNEVFRWRPVGGANDDHEIVDVRPSRPGGPGAPAIAYELQLRK